MAVQWITQVGQSARFFWNQSFFAITLDIQFENLYITRLLNQMGLSGLVGYDLCEFNCTATSVFTYNFILFCQWLNSGRKRRRTSGQIAQLFLKWKFREFFQFPSNKNRGTRLQGQFSRHWMNAKRRFSQNPSVSLLMSQYFVKSGLYSSHGFSYKSHWKGPGHSVSPGKRFLHSLGPGGKG